MSNLPFVPGDAPAKGRIGKDTDRSIHNRHNNWPATMPVDWVNARNSATGNVGHASGGGQGDGQAALSRAAGARLFGDSYTPDTYQRNM